MLTYDSIYPSSYPRAGPSVVDIDAVVTVAAFAVVAVAAVNLNIAVQVCVWMMTTTERMILSEDPGQQRQPVSHNVDACACRL